MLTKVKGKIIENSYYIENNLKKIRKDNNDKLVYTEKPKLMKESRIVKWEDICNFDGKPYYNKHVKTFYDSKNSINISENEEVTIDKEVFRADLNELHLFTDKIVEEIENFKEEVEESFKRELELFNEMMIESNEKLLSYCKLHKLNPKETDCIELFKLVYGHGNYKIVDGIMTELNLNLYYDNCSSIGTLTSTTITYNDYAKSGELSAKY